MSTPSIEVEKTNRNVHCVVLALNVRVHSLCCGSVHPIVIFVEKLWELLGERYVDFDKLNSIKKTAYVLGSQLWEYVRLIIYSA